jgi:FkbM family methyltransferase
MSFAERLIVAAASNILPEKVAYRIARAALASQGIGWAGPSNGLSGSGEAKFLEKRLTNLHKPCVFDVGANVGEYALATLLANPNVRLHCFEPSPFHYAILQEKLSSKASQVSINPFGLSDTTEVRSLHKDSEVTGLASLINRDLSHLDIYLSKLEDVHLDTGDNYVSSNGIERIDLLKVDVEGWEMSVLKGFSKTFANSMVRCCQFEFGHAHIERRENFRDFYRFFCEHGFKFGVLKPNGCVQWMSSYNEIFENYYATNYVAMLT